MTPITGTVFLAQPAPYTASPLSVAADELLNPGGRHGA